ncbi:Zinc finger protein 654 [Acipenser ruthenus]|uniref:Zinc finger protein 654 n=1 Tax=Acipenser ruthenus TaxID=7906 RepID=A0A444UB41_ACIRT|nr:Zinc finger protein 654 [Acipenser ruthenus]
MAEEESDHESERLREELESSLEHGVRDENGLPSKYYCFKFCQVVEEYAGRWQVPLPQLQVFQTALCCFTKGTATFPAECEQIQYVLSSLALSFFELLLFFGKDEFLEDPLKDIIESFQECHTTLARYKNVYLKLVKQIIKEGGPWENPVLKAVLKETPQPQETVDMYLNSEIPAFFEIRVRYLLACERIQEAVALSKCCIPHPEVGTNLYFYQAYLTCLFKASLRDHLHKEMAGIDSKDAVEIICNAEREEKDEVLLGLCRAFLIQQLETGNMYYIWDLIFIWSKLQLRANSSKQDFLEECQQLLLAATNVKMIFPFMKAIETELGDEGLQVCVQLCACTLNMDHHDDPNTKSLVYKIIAYLLPNDLEVCRACALAVFFLERSVEAYTTVYNLYTFPDQEYHVDHNLVKNQVRFELLQILKKGLYFDPEFWNLIMLKKKCMSLMGDKALLFTFSETVEEDELPLVDPNVLYPRVSPPHHVKEDKLLKHHVKKADQKSSRRWARRLDFAAEDNVRKVQKKSRKRRLKETDKKSLRRSLRQLDIIQEGQAKLHEKKTQKHTASQRIKKSQKHSVRLHHMMAVEPVQKMEKSPKHPVGQPDKAQECVKHLENKSPQHPVKQMHTPEVSINQLNTKSPKHQVVTPEDSMKQSDESAQGPVEQPGQKAPENHVKQLLKIAEHPVQELDGAPEVLVKERGEKTVEDPIKQPDKMPDDSEKPANVAPELAVVEPNAKLEGRVMESASNPEGPVAELDTKLEPLRTQEGSVVKSDSKPELPLIETKRAQEGSVLNLNVKPKSPLLEQDKLQECTVAEQKISEECTFVEPDRSQEFSIEEPDRLQECSVAEPDRLREYAVAEPKRLQECAVAEPDRLQECAVAETDRLRECAVAEPDRSQEYSVAEPDRSQECSIEEPDKLREYAVVELDRSQECSIEEPDKSKYTVVEPERSQESAVIIPDKTADDLFKQEETLCAEQPVLRLRNRQKVIKNAQKDNSHLGSPKTDHSVPKTLCILCNREFLGGHIIRHALIHARKGTYSCAMCGRKFKQRVCLQKHLKDHMKKIKLKHSPDGQLPNACTPVENGTSEDFEHAFSELVLPKNQHKNHRQSVAAVENYTDKQNNIVSENPDSSPNSCLSSPPLSSNDKNTEDAKSSKDMCLVKRANGTVIKQKKSRKEKRKFSCPAQGCSKTYNERWIVIKHARKAHPEDMKVKEHIMKLHKGKCWYCQREFMDSKHFLDHLNRHTDSKKYFCLHLNCSERFKTAGELLAHVKSHTVLQAQCAVDGCCEIFSELSSLHDHECQHYSDKTVRGASEETSSPVLETVSETTSGPSPGVHKSSLVINKTKPVEDPTWKMRKESTKTYLQCTVMKPSTNANLNEKVLPVASSVDQTDILEDRCSASVSREQLLNGHSREEKTSIEDQTGSKVDAVEKKPDQPESKVEVEKKEPDPPETQVTVTQKTPEHQSPHVDGAPKDTGPISKAQSKKEKTCGEKTTPYGCVSKRPFVRPPPSAYLDEQYISMPKRRKTLSPKAESKATRPEMVVSKSVQRHRCSKCFTIFSDVETLESHLAQNKCKTLFGFDSDEESK